MSDAIDVNVLLVAANTADADHARAVSFLERRARDRETLCLSWHTLLAFVRIATHAAIFPRPLTAEQAHDSVDALLALPQARVIVEEEGFWLVYRDVTAGRRVRGKLVPDAHLAALLKQHGVRRLYTRDADFARFDFLDVVDPLAA